MRQNNQGQFKSIIFFPLILEFTALYLISLIHKSIFLALYNPSLSLQSSGYAEEPTHHLIFFLSKEISL